MPKLTHRFSRGGQGLRFKIQKCGLIEENARFTNAKIMTLQADCQKFIEKNFDLVEA